MTWLLLGQVLFYAIAVIALAVLRPLANGLYRTMRDAPDGALTAELAAEVQKPQAAIAGTVTTVMFVAVIYLMVARPDW